MRFSGTQNRATSPKNAGTNHRRVAPGAGRRAYPPYFGRRGMGQSHGSCQNKLGSGAFRPRRVWAEPTAYLGTKNAQTY
jgi:hypothetical protein